MRRRPERPAGSTGHSYPGRACRLCAGESRVGRADRRAQITRFWASFAPCERPLLPLPTSRWPRLLAGRRPCRGARPAADALDAQFETGLARVPGLARGGSRDLGGRLRGEYRRPQKVQALTNLRIELLGGFHVTVGARAVSDDAWRRRKPAALLKLLALAPGHRLHREQVMDRLWPELDPWAAAANLRKALHQAGGAS